MESQKKVRVNINVSEELYAAYKKALIDMKTNTTYDIIRHMQEVVEQHPNKD